MPSCEVCGNDYDKAFEVVVQGASQTLGVEKAGQIFCCAHCAGDASGLRDRA